jgi:hypothetical protein
MQYIMCVVFPSGLLGGMIVLEGFTGKLLKFELGSTQEVDRKSNNQQ